MHVSPQEGLESITSWAAFVDTWVRAGGGREVWGTVGMADGGADRHVGRPACG